MAGYMSVELHSKVLVEVINVRVTSMSIVLIKEKRSQD